MGYFSETVATALSGRTVQATMLVYFDFVDEPMGLWPGFGALKTNDGREWSGLGELGNIEGLEQALGTAAPVVTFTLTGIDPSIMAKAKAASATVKGRDVTVYLQTFDADSAPLDEPYALWSGILDVMSYKAVGAASRTVSVTAETLWTGRRKPPFAYYTDTDQQARFPDDRGLEQVSSLVSKRIVWPNF
jgi:hypothetical protein